MKAKNYMTINRLLQLGVIGLFVTSLITSNSLFTFFGIGFYMVIISLLKTRVNGVIADERQVLVSEKASQSTFKIFMPILMLTTIILIIGGGKEEFYYVKALGIVFSYITSLSLLIYIVSYWYFNRKTGGR